MTTIGLLHPGEMGTAVGAAARAGGARVLWASEGRGAQTRARAEADGLEDAGTLTAVTRASEVVVSVCPPHAALDLARGVAAAGFRGIFVDANAVSPATARQIGLVVEAAGARFVDGGIIGPPPRKLGVARLYLAGADAKRVAEVFAAGPLEAITLDGGPGAASALKMAYAAWTKGSAALLMAVRAVASAEDVDDALLAEWKRSIPDLPARSENAVAGSARKAWRWIAEMEEIAATFAAAGLPAGFHDAAADLYERLAGYKDAPAAPSVREAVDVLRRGR
jgi:3-hydroxyisobutyrate dehydrogenase-like beta-hydroxyacid dehydrogenase